MQQLVDAWLARLPQRSARIVTLSHGLHIPEDLPDEAPARPSLAQLWSLLSQLARHRTSGLGEPWFVAARWHARPGLATAHPRSRSLWIPRGSRSRVCAVVL